MLKHDFLKKIASKKSRKMHDSKKNQIITSKTWHKACASAGPNSGPRGMELKNNWKSAEGVHPSSAGFPLFFKGAWAALFGLDFLFTFLSRKK